MESIAVPSRRILGLRPLHLLCLALIALALGLGISALGSAFTPYVSVAEAQATARHVQVYGFLAAPGSYTPDGHFTFGLQDEHGHIMTVVYPRGKPANFDQAIGFVAIGRFDHAQGAFHADDLLVKCPSKYQEQAAQDAAGAPDAR